MEKIKKNQKKGYKRLTREDMRTGFGRACWDNGIKPTELARVSGIRYQTIRNWMTGDFQPVITNGLAAICDYMVSKYMVVMSLADFISDQDPTGEGEQREEIMPGYNPVDDVVELMSFFKSKGGKQ